MTDHRLDRLLRLPEVRENTGLSRATIYRKMDRGEFPKAVKLGANSVAWRESAIRIWIAAPMDWQAEAA